MKLEEIKNCYYNDLASVNSDAELQDIRVKYLGKSGMLTDALKVIKDLAPQDRKAYGEQVNSVKVEIEDNITAKHEELVNKAIEDEISNTQKVDLTVPLAMRVGSLHPITIVQQRIVDIFASMGFTVEDGNEIETEYNNFEAVNVPKDHPARDMQDTFWLDNGEVLKTQTSAGQNRIMRKYGAPLKAIFFC